MLILVQKDAATKVSKDVADVEEAKGFASNGFHVSVQNEDGTYTELSEFLAAQEPTEDAEETKPAAKKPAAKKK